MADVRPLTKEVQKDLPGSNPNIQMPALLEGSANSKERPSSLKALPFITDKFALGICGSGEEVKALPL